MTPTRTLAAAAALAVSIIMPPPPARASGFDARPVTIETRDGMASVVITNPGDRRIYLEAQIYDWSRTPPARMS